MKKLLFALIFTGIFAQAIFAAESFELTFDLTDTGSVAVSTSIVTPTQILSNNPAAMRTLIINTSTATVYLVGPSTVSLTTPATVSTNTATGSFYLVGGSTVNWSPDGAGPYTGPMWATTSAGPGISITRVRLK